MKNDNRIASVLGTWTGQKQMKARFGHYELDVYFTMHLMPNPMRGYSCEYLQDQKDENNDSRCSEIDNYVCVDDIKRGKECVSFTDDETVVNWSDVSAFFNFGFFVDAGFPHNFHLNHTTDGWIGPYSIIMAQNVGVAHDTTNTLIDQYVARYVKTLSTPYLQRNYNSTLFGEADSDAYMGPMAVNTTIHKQTKLRPKEDPYFDSLGTCKNGGIQPILPRFQVGFSRDVKTNADRLEIQLDYKLLTIPKKGDMDYYIMAQLQRKFNHDAHHPNAFHISGPYCYQDDPKRGYTFDFSFNSTALPPKDGAISWTKGCLKGLPCYPPAASIGSKDHIIVYNQTHPRGQAEILDINGAFLSFACYFLALGLIVSLTCNCQLSGKVKRLQHRRTSSPAHNDPSLIPTTTTTTTTNPPYHPPESPYGDLGGFTGTEEDLAQPLLQPPTRDQEGRGSTLDTILSSPARHGTSGFAEQETI